MNIAGFGIGGSNPCRVIAELSNNHNGSLALAKRLIGECARARADFVKFQCYSPDELVALRGDGPAPDPWGSEGWTMRDLYAKAQTSHDWFPELVEHCRAVGVPWFSSVFGPESLALLESLDCPAYKVAALDEGSPDLRAATLSTGKPVIVSTHGPERVEWADLTLHCPPGYPQPRGAVDFDAIERGTFDGLSYHGTSWMIPGVAAWRGAALVEVHVQLTEPRSELEARVSLTTAQLRELGVYSRASAKRSGAVPA